MFGSDDEEYVRGQLAKLGGTVPVVVPCGSDADDPTSGAMKKGSTNHDAPPLAPADPASAAVNPYTKGDKVKTACKGADVEAEVTAVYKDEVQVRTPDGELRWRTVRTVQPVIVPPAVSNPSAGNVQPVVRHRKPRTQRRRT